MNGLPGGRLDPDEDPVAQAQAARRSPGGGPMAPNAPRPPRQRPGRPQSAGPGPVGSLAAAQASSDPRVLLQGLADLVRQLRAMDMDRWEWEPGMGV